MTQRDSDSLENNTIKVITLAEAIRARPKLYVGSIDQKGLCWLVCLLVLESIDGVAIRREIDGARFRATRVEIVLHSDRSVTVHDNGRGLPVGEVTLGGREISRAEEILTNLSVPAYNGLAITNALSQRLTLKVLRDGYEWQQEYRAGMPTTDLVRVSSSDQHGPGVRFLPEGEIFSALDYDFDSLTEELRKLASSHSNLTIKITDERITAEGRSHKTLLLGE